MNKNLLAIVSFMVLVGCSAKKLEYLSEQEIEQRLDLPE